MFKIKNLILFFFLSISLPSNLLADNTYIIDFAKVLNKSLAGKEAQDYLKKRINSTSKEFVKIEKKLLEDEQVIVGKKKILSKEEYQKEVSKLRDRVAKHQSNKSKTLNEVGKLRADARTKILKNLNPLLADYMKEKKIRIIIDKKSVLLSDVSLDITDEIINLLNKKIKSLNLK